jgi:hypothetical protein
MKPSFTWDQIELISQPFSFHDLPFEYERLDDDLIHIGSGVFLEKRIREESVPDERLREWVYWYRSLRAAAHVQGATNVGSGDLLALEFPIPPVEIFGITELTYGAVARYEGPLMRNTDVELRYHMRSDATYYAAGNLYREWHFEKRARKKIDASPVYGTAWRIQDGLRP